MLSQSSIWWYGPDVRIWVNVLPKDVVSFDFDAPTPEYRRGEKMRDLFLSKVQNFATIAAGMWNLGRFWVIGTDSGFHVLFEKPHEDWPKVMRWATKQWLWDGEAQHGMCKGYAENCMAIEYCRLRVGRKGERRPDLEFLTPLDDAPDFVREHYLYIETLRGLDV